MLHQDQCEGRSEQGDGDGMAKSGGGNGIIGLCEAVSSSYLHRDSHESEVEVDGFFRRGRIDSKRVD
jgi:hypothetical protein